MTRQEIQNAVAHIARGKVVREPSAVALDACHVERELYVQMRGGSGHQVAVLRM